MYAEKRTEETLRHFEAQITVKFTVPLEIMHARQIQCRLGHNSVQPYISSVPNPPSTAQDTLWGDVKSRVVPGLLVSLDAFTFYSDQSDFELNLEYGKSGILGHLGGSSLMYQDVFDIVEPLDNVLIEEYEVEYAVKRFLSTQKITLLYHKIVKVEREGKVIFPLVAGTETSPELGESQNYPAQFGSVVAFGTGFFISNEGHILTCYHVVKNGRTLSVTTFYGIKFVGHLIQSDPVNDIALLKVDAITKSLPLADTSALAKGDEVMTLGYPLIGIQGQDQKATFGRINSVSGIQGDIRLLQIDVPIQPGNSGGPLINRRNEVVGMVTSSLDYFSTIMATGASPQNVNYAIKSDYMIPLLRACLNDTKQRVEPDATISNFPDIIKRSESCIVLITVT